MPGQRKRKRKRQRQGRGTGAEAGRWDVLFETQDESEWRTHLRDLRTAESQIDWDVARIDTLCGRLTHPTTYRLSVFIPDSRSAGPGVG